jgi:RNA polymerase sigma-70 factor (ECF subfamily)
VTIDLAALSDGQLWARAANQRDGEAFGQLFERHANAVYAHCFRRTGSWSAAEDLTSVVFLEAWRKRRDVRLTGESVLPWLLAVANNATRNAERSIRRHQRLLARLPSAETVPDVADDAAKRADEEHAMRLILAGLRSLTEPEREVLALCDWAGLTYAEAAAALGVPPGTVRSRLARARQHLRERAAQAAPIVASVTTSKEDQP